MAVFTAEVAVEDEGSKGSSFGQGGLGATEMSQDLEFVRALWEDSLALSLSDSGRMRQNEIQGLKLLKTMVSSVLHTGFIFGSVFNICFSF